MEMTRAESLTHGQSLVVEEPKFADAFIFREDVEDEGFNARKRVIQEIRALGLVERAWELEVDGYTVLSPDEAGSTKITERLRKAAVALAERRLGHPADLEQGSDQSTMSSPFGQVQPEIGILGEDPVFEEALINRVTLALVSYLLGESCSLIFEGLFFKGPGPDHLPLHTDQDQTGGPSPFPAYAQVANATWALTDYTMENGPICFVPGSHKLCRAPNRHEATDLKLFVPVEMEAGSIVIWHGNTWHGALRKSAPGLRISLLQFFGRWYSSLSNALPITDEMIDRNPPRFGRLVRPTGRRSSDGRPTEDLGSVKLQAAKETMYG
jgi:hypothetical protein